MNFTKLLYQENYNVKGKENPVKSYEDLAGFFCYIGKFSDLSYITKSPSGRICTNWNGRCTAYPIRRGKACKHMEKCSVAGVCLHALLRYMNCVSSK